MADRKIVDLTLSLARKYAQPAEVIRWVDEPLTDELQSMGVSFYDLELPASCDRITRTQLFNYYFESDEVASASIFSFDGVEFMLSQKYGDKSSWENDIINHQAYVEFVKFIAELSINHRLSQVGASDPDIRLLPNSYVVFTESETDLAVHVLHPKWGTFQWLFRDHVALYNGEPVEFVRWANNLPSWKQTDEPDVIVKFQDGTEQAVTGISIAFILQPSAVVICD